LVTAFIAVEHKYPDDLGFVPEIAEVWNLWRGNRIDAPDASASETGSGRYPLAHELIPRQECEMVLGALKERIRSAQLDALRSVNREQISLYWILDG
jgi:hypothetical protein